MQTLKKTHIKQFLSKCRAMGCSGLPILLTYPVDDKTLLCWRDQQDKQCLELQLPLKTDRPGYVHRKALEQALSQIEDKEITTENCLVFLEKISFDNQCLHSCNFPRRCRGIDQVMPGENAGSAGFTVKTKAFLEAIAIAKNSLYPNGTKPTLTNFCLTISRDGLKIEATDGVQLTQVYIEVSYFKIAGDAKDFRFLIPKSVTSLSGLKALLGDTMVIDAHSRGITRFRTKERDEHSDYSRQIQLHTQVKSFVEYPMTNHLFSYKDLRDQSLLSVESVKAEAIALNKYTQYLRGCKDQLFDETIESLKAKAASYADLPYIPEHDNAYLKFGPGYFSADRVLDIAKNLQNKSTFSVFAGESCTSPVILTSKTSLTYTRHALMPCEPRNFLS